MTHEFNARQFLIDHFHDAPGVVAYLRGKGVEPPSEAAVAKWLHRNSISGEWLAKLAALLEEDNNGKGQIHHYVES